LVYIDGLNELPYDCKQRVKDKYGACYCYHDRDSDGPSYCTLLLMLSGDYFNAHPDRNKCPLRKRQKT